MEDIIVLGHTEVIGKWLLAIRIKVIWIEDRLQGFGNVLNRSVVGDGSRRLTEQSDRKAATGRINGKSLNGIQYR